MKSISPLSAPSSFDELGVDFACNILAIERRLLCAGWLNPQKLYEAGAEAELADDDFADRGHALIYKYLGVSIEQGWSGQRHPHDLCQSARHYGVALEVEHVWEIILCELDRFRGDPTAELPELCAIVKSYAARRHEAEVLLREAAKLLAGDPTEFEVFIQSKRRRLKARVVA